MGKLTKAQREQVRTMFDGHCAYCGCELPARWHADHVDPILRGDWIGQPASAPENDRIDNYMPACAPCNISKGRMKLETWRNWLAAHINSLNAHNSVYRIVKAFGLVRETGSPVTFYFETAGRSALNGEG